MSSDQDIFSLYLAIMHAMLRSLYVILVPRSSFGMDMSFVSLIFLGIVVFVIGVTVLLISRV